MAMKEKEYDKLADIVRANLDINYIYQIMRLLP
jgi:adenosylcobyric acid synthase